MAQWDTYSVKKIISEIKDDKFVLPVIQRRLVWQEEKMELLFNSLLRGNSFGSIICIEEEKGYKPLFAYRSFTRDGSNVSSVQADENLINYMLVIDGQQRLQSFYMGLYGTYNKKVLFFNLLSDYVKEEYDFKFADSIDSIDDCFEDGILKKCLWYQTSNLFYELSKSNDIYSVSESIWEKYSITDNEERKCIMQNITKFNSSIFSSDTIGVSKVIIDRTKTDIQNKQNIVELFRRLNDGGTRLSPYDLLSSKLKGFDYKMEEFLDKLVGKYSNIGFTEDMIIKLILILNDNPLSEITNITQEEALFVVDNFERIKNSIEATKKFLILSENYYWFCTTKNRPVTPLYFIVYHIFYSNIKTEDIPNMFDNYDIHNSAIPMIKWLRISLLNRTFSEGCGWIPYKTGLKKMHHVLHDCKGKPFPYERIINVYRNHPIHNFSTEINESSILNFNAEYILFMLYGDKEEIRSIDIDHIHPKSILRRMGVDKEKMNCIANYQLIESGTNRNIKRNKELYIWINKYVNSENRDGYIKRNILPQNESLWHSENYEDFYKGRLRIIAHLLKKKFEKIC